MSTHRAKHGQTRSRYVHESSAAGVK